jgi:hypothetical protein
MLSPSDLEEDADVSVPAAFGSIKPEHIVYAVQMARVARLREFQLFCIANDFEADSKG